MAAKYHDIYSRVSRNTASAKTRHV
jgi:hypothetical protein